jgi:hypothetical protein
MSDLQDNEKFDDDIEWTDDQDQTDEPPFDTEELCRLSGVRGIGEFLHTYLEKNTQEIIKVLISKFGDEGNDLEYARNLNNIVREVSEYFEVFVYEGKKIYCTDFSGVTEIGGEEPVDYVRAIGIDKDNNKYEVRWESHPDAWDHYIDDDVCVICKTNECIYKDLDEEGVDWSKFTVKPL